MSTEQSVHHAGKKSSNNRCQPKLIAAETKDSSKKESELLYFKLFPTHKPIEKRIPKKKAMEIIPETHDGGYEKQHEIHQKTREENQDKPFDSLGRYKGPYGTDIDWINPLKKPRKKQRKKPFKSHSMETECTTLPNDSSRYECSTPPNDSSRYASIPMHRFDSNSDQQPNQSIVKNTIVQVAEKKMYIESENGHKKLVCQKFRNIMNVETVVRDLPDKDSEQIDEFLRFKRNCVQNE